MSTSWEVDNETMAGVNTHKLPEWLRMQDSAILNNTKKAKKLGMKVSEVNNILTHSLLSCSVSSALPAFFNPDRQLRYNFGFGFMKIIEQFSSYLAGLQRVSF